MKDRYYGWLAACGFGLCILSMLMLRGKPSITETHLAEQFSPPSSEHWFGTDNLGRDIFKRTLAGAGYTSSLVLLALSGASVLGVSFGLWSGLSEHSFVKWLQDQMVNIVWSVPGLVLFITVTSYFGRDFSIIAVTLAAVAWAPIARVVRIEVEREKRENYVTALRSFGFGKRKVIQSILTNVRASIYVALMTVALDLVAAESGLSFLGMGIQPPAPSLGAMIYDGIVYMAAAWWMLVFPLAALLVLVVMIRLLLPGQRTL